MTQMFIFYHLSIKLGVSSYDRSTVTNFLFLSLSNSSWNLFDGDIALAFSLFSYQHKSKIRRPFNTGSTVATFSSSVDFFINT